MKRLALLACLGFTQLVAADSEPGPYMGAALGTFDYDEGDGEFAVSDSTSAYQLFGGYKFNAHLAVEGGIGRTGDIEQSFTETIPGVGPVTLDLDATYDIYSLKVLGLLPFDRFSLFGSAGYYSASLDGRANLRGFGEIGSFDGHERGATATAGIQYDFRLDLRNLSVRGEYQWFDFGSEVDAHGLNVGVLFRF